MPIIKKYVFVLDAEGKRLDPTIEQNAWRLVRQHKARLMSKFPMVIQLNKVVANPNSDEIRCGIDDGTNRVGLALVQKCQTKNKVLFKGTIEQRKDVKHLLDVRRGYRRYHRYHKQYRPARFLNRASSKRSGRLMPSIIQRKQATLRVIDRLCQWIRIDSYRLEDVKIDIRALTEGYKPYRWQYQRSNRLDNNLRLAAIYRDGCKCMECGKVKTRFEVHHITPQETGGADTISNLITLCPKCHARTFGRESQFADMYYAMIGSQGNVEGLDDAQRVMQGKHWFREQLQQRGTLLLTTGGDTANKRDDWNIPKTHANDAVCITDLKSEMSSNTEHILQQFFYQTLDIHRFAYSYYFMHTSNTYIQQVMWITRDILDQIALDLANDLLYVKFNAPLEFETSEDFAQRYETIQDWVEEYIEIYNEVVCLILSQDAQDKYDMLLRQLNFTNTNKGE